MPRYRALTPLATALVEILNECKYIRGKMSNERVALLAGIQQSALNIVTNKRLNAMGSDSLLHAIRTLQFDIAITVTERELTHEQADILYAKRGTLARRIVAIEDARIDARQQPDEPVGWQLQRPRVSKRARQIAANAARRSK